MAFSAVLSYFLRWFQVLIDWGQSIYHWCPTHEKSVPGTEARGADRPEAYPTGNEKQRADVQLGGLIRPEGFGVEQMSYTNLGFLVIVNAVIALHLIVLFRALRLYRGFGSCPPHFTFRMNKLARCCRCFG